MAATRRALFPPILKTVNRPTWSALGKAVLKATKESKSDRFMISYQCARLDLAVAWISANSFSRLRVITCILDGEIRAAFAKCNQAKITRRKKPSKFETSSAVRVPAHAAFFSANVATAKS
jgi:hypothetical protein